MDSFGGAGGKEQGKFFLDLAKLAYGGGVLVPFGAWALEKKIGTVGLIPAQERNILLVAVHQQ